MGPVRLREPGGRVQRRRGEGDDGGAVDAEKGADVEEGVEKGTLELVAGAEAEVLSADEGEEEDRIAYP